MNIKPESTVDSYYPVRWEFREVIEEQITKETEGKIFFFCENEGICEAISEVVELKEIGREGVFILLKNENKIRIDRIITLFGKPGAAYEEYESYGNECMNCTGGYNN